MADRIPVTVIGGYLGAGKTSLVNHILRSAEERIAVIVNDFGDINIDASLIADNDDALRDGVLALANGCICCSLVDGFASALETIANVSPAPDRLVIEASGVSDPAQVAAYCHGPGLSLDAVVVLVDTETIRARVDDAYVGQTVSQQLSAADVLVLNKQDLIDASDAVAVHEWVAASYPDALIVQASNGVVATEVLFGQTTRGAPATVTSVPIAFTSWTISASGVLSRDAIESLMNAIPDTVIRMKGFVVLDDVPDREMVLQRVGKRWTLRRGQLRNDASISQIVCIATDASARADVAATLDGLGFTPA